MSAAFQSAHACGLRLNEGVLSCQFLTSPDRRKSLGELLTVHPATLMSRVRTRITDFSTIRDFQHVHSVEYGSNCER